MGAKLGLQGQSYVALSRASALEGLQVVHFNPMKVSHFDIAWGVAGDAYSMDPGRLKHMRRSLTGIGHCNCRQNKTRKVLNVNYYPHKLIATVQPGLLDAVIRNIKWHSLHESCCIRP